MAEFRSIEDALAALRGEPTVSTTPEAEPIQPSPETTPATNQVMRRAEFQSMQEARQALGGSLVGVQPQVQPPVVPQAMTGLPPSEEDPLAGVDVRTGADFALRARTAFQPTTEDKKVAIENALRNRGIDVQSNPVEVVEGFFPNFVIPVPDPKVSGGYRRVLFDPSGFTSFGEFIKDVGADLAGDIIPMAMGIGAASKLATTAKALPIRPTIGRIFKESVPPASALALQTRIAREQEGIPQPTPLGEAGEFATGLGFDVIGGSVVAAAPRLLGRNYGQEILNKGEIKTYKDAVEDFNLRFNQSYQPTAGTIMMDEDLLALENFLATQSPIYSAQLKQIKTTEKIAIRAAAIEMLQDFDPDIKALKPEDLSPVNKIKASYLKDIEAAESATAQSSRELLAKATDQMFREIDKLSPTTKIQSPEEAGAAIRNFIQESKDIFQRQSEKNYAEVESAIANLQRTAPTSANWDNLVSMDPLTRVLEDERLQRAGGIDALMGVLPERIRSVIDENPNGLNLRAARRLRTLLSDQLNQEKLKAPTGSLETNLLGQLSSAIDSSLNDAIDSLPTSELRNALGKANSEYKQYKDLFKIDILQRIANQTAKGELNEASILPKILGNEKSYFDLKKAMLDLPASEAVDPSTRWPSIQKNMLASVLNVTGQGSDKVAFSEIYNQLKGMNSRIRKDLLGSNHESVVSFLRDMSEVLPGKQDDLLKATKKNVLEYLQDPASREAKAALIKAKNDANQLLNVQQKSSFTRALNRLRKDGLDPEANELIRDEGFINRVIEKSDLKQVSDMMSRIIDPTTKSIARKNVIRQLFQDTGILDELYAQSSIKSGDKLYNRLRKSAPKFKAVLGEQVFNDLTSLATVASRVRISKKEGGETAGSLSRGRVLRDLLSFRFLDLIGDLRMRVGASILSNPELVEGFINSGRRNPGSFAVWASVLTAPDFVENFRAGYDDTFAFAKDYALLMDAAGIAEGMLDSAPVEQQQPQQPEPVQQ